METLMENRALRKGKYFQIALEFEKKSEEGLSSL